MNTKKHSTCTHDNFSLQFLASSTDDEQDEITLSIPWMLTYADVTYFKNNVAMTYFCLEYV